MGVHKFYFCKTQIVFLFRKMGFSFRVLWVYFSTCVFTLFGYLFRFQEKFKTQKNNSNFMLFETKDDQHTNENVTKDDESETGFRFRFPTYEEFLQKNDKGQSFSQSVLCENSDDKISDVESENDDYVGSEIDTIANSSLEFSLVEENNVVGEISSRIENNVSNVIEHVMKENSEKMDVEMREMMNDSTNNEDVMKSGCEFLSLSKSLMNDSTNNEDVMSNENVMRNGGHLPSDYDDDDDDDVMRNGGHLPSSGYDDVKESSDKMNFEMREMVNDSTNNEYIVNKENALRNGGHLPSDDNDDDGGDDDDDDDESLVSDSDSMAPSSESSLRSSFIDSLSDGLLSDIDFEKAFEVDTSKEFDLNEIGLTKEALRQEDIELHNLIKGYEADDYDDEDEDILKELKNLESNLVDDSLEKEHGENTNNEAENKQAEEKTSSGEQLSSDSDEQNGLETQWEHQDLVEQLKMEIRKVRATGLPTILEESESPKIMDDLKPWKIKDKYQYGGTTTMDELLKFYKSYKERMRKLDILNYQKMYAIGFLRLKDPLQSFTKSKFSTPALTTIVSLDCWPCKPKTLSEIEEKPGMKKFSRELEADLEMVYVGQMCLSWEFLRWQYGKALELWESDPRGIKRYNEVADRFQTFQVLLTRFLEDEQFQGPRVQTYVQNRCLHRNLLQVPLIRDDNRRDRSKEKEVSSNDAITSLQLLEIIEESIRTLWRFIKTDKDTSNNVVLLKCRRSSNVELQSPADASLLAEVRSTLQKKEKKLRDLLKSEKCILRKINKNQEEEEPDHVLYFFSQVDLRLVTRVLNMPKISTEQLVWCSDKLSNIHLVGRKLHVESSVLLFPCS